MSDTRTSHDRFASCEDALHEEAVKHAGSDDFGDPSYLDGLRVLLRSLDESRTLSELGRSILRNQVLTSLTTRLR